MPFVTDSKTPGYLGPKVAPAPLESDAWEDFLHDVVTGVTGLDPKLVRPRWQPKPPNRPPVDTTWSAVGVTNTIADWDPAVYHVDTGDGYDAFQRHEVNVILCSFYGPEASATASLLRDGIFIEQNRAVLRANGVGLVEVGDKTNAPELFRGQWIDRVDLNLVLRREVRRDYPVLNLLRSIGTITASDPGNRILHDSWDTSHPR